MIKKLLLLAVIFALGFAVWHYRTAWLPTATNILQPVIGLASSIKNVIGKIAEPWRSLLTAIVPTAAGAGLVAFIKNGVISRLQSNAQTTVQDLQGQVTETATTNLKLQSNLETAQNQVTAFTEKEKLWDQEKQNLEQKLVDAQKEVLRVQAEANALSHISEEKIAERVAQIKKDASRVP